MSDDNHPEDQEAAEAVKKALGRTNIRERRPVQIQFRLTTDENDALWAMHVKTQRSKSSCLRELVVEGLKARGLLDAETARRILDQEKTTKTAMRVPVL